MATTSAVNVSDFTETIEPHLKEGRDVLVVAFSSGLSATCHSAQIAAQELSEQYPERKVYVVDSLCASLGQGLLVWYAARMKNEGRGIGAVRDWLEENKLHLCHWFTVDDLHFLKRGGRISSATAVLGTMLSIKPVMHVDDEGHLTKVGTARGRNASLKLLSAVGVVGDVELHPADALHAGQQAVVHVVPVLAVLLQEGLEVLLVLDGQPGDPVAGKPGAEGVQLRLGGVQGHFQPLHVLHQRCLPRKNRATVPGPVWLPMVVPTL